MAIPLLPWQLPPEFYFLINVVFELIEARISFTYFSRSLVDSFCSLCLFLENLGEKL